MLVFGVLYQRESDDQQEFRAAVPTSATIQSVQTSKITTFGILSFALTTPKGPIACEERVRLGSSFAAFKAGEQVLVVPRAGACPNPLVGSAQQSPLPYAAAALAALAGVIVYGLRAVRG